MLLELRGYTFEAELRYHRLASSSPVAASRLGLMLEAQGRRDEAWKMYLRAASGNDMAALFRLSVICSQRGEEDLATRFFRRAAGQFNWKGVRKLNCEAARIKRDRKVSPLLLGKRFMTSLRSVSIDTQFALGSYLYVIAGRADLARLAYCSATGRGHSLAAVTLLDVVPRHRPGGMEQTGYLKRLLRLSGCVGDYTDVANPTQATSSLERTAESLTNTMQDVSYDELAEAIATTGSDYAYRRVDAVERILINARTLTTMRGYANIGWGSADLYRIDEAADRACVSIKSMIDEGIETADGAQLLNLMWDICNRELSIVVGTSGWEGEGASAGLAGPAVAMQLPDAQRVPSSGAVSRFGGSFSKLSPDEARVVTQRVSGQFRYEVAKSMGMTDSRARMLFKSAEGVMREAQRGEQIPMGNRELWHDVEDSFAGLDNEDLGFLDSGPDQGWGDDVSD